MLFRHRPRFRYFQYVLFTAGLVLLASGCGGDGPKQYPVEGTVTLDDKPVTGSVAFHPDSSKGNKSTVAPGGDADAGGKFTLFTGGKAGAPPGWYKVTVAEKEELDSTKPESKSKVNKSKYNDPEKTPWTVEVVEKPGADAYKLTGKVK